MATTKAHDINALGQSIWYDNIRRLFLENGEIARLIEAGVLGMTSNPTIFEKAIAGSTDYDADMRRLVEAGETPNAIYEALAVGDIRRAADLLQPVYEETNGVDGYISLEVNPLLAHDTEGTIREAQRLFALVGRPNVMIKVPATPEGIPAIATLIAGGININVTLIFALDKYREVMDAYLAGLEKRLAVGGDLTRIASVASFFVSRVDSAVDKLLAAKGNTDLQGKVAIANAKVAYALFQTVFSGTRWAKLTEAGARVQRPLWASTGTKNPAYPDTHYVDTLIGPDTVNTMPPATLEATLDHGVPAATIMQGMDTAHAQLAQLGALGIDIDGVTQTLLEEGVEAFKKSFESLMGSITVKRRHLIAEIQGRSAVLGMYEGAVAAALERMDTERIPARITLKDHTVWGSDPAEISNRLGWLDSPTVMKPVTDAIYDIADEVWSDGITKALVLGMGGSSLAPEVFAKTFGVNTAHLELGVLDSTDADTVRDFAYRFPPEDTLYIVSSKSGGTVEMVSFFRYFYNLTAETFGAENKAKIGEHFIAITDPGSGLQKMAEDYLFRSVFLNDPNIGGRYSALSYFGLFPAALDGVDLYKLLDRASLMVDRCGATLPAADNYGAWLGAILGVLATQGRDKATFILSPTIASFGDWVEQLIAESTGKNGKGILPVVGESVGAPEVYGTDRAFFYLKTAGDSTHDAAVDALQAAGHPVIRLHLSDPYD
ncbi:MAG TPA: bifunctional transaldolase/phosoglucose isomerase, partial [Aggregatilineales bacterium]|nr:bifunctional transaldolase/phosoglucose isomerase [Aggregatilineales bacterium]